MADKIVRWIHVGLLCIQDEAAQSLTMSTVLIMLNSSSGALIDQLKPSAALVSEEASSSVPAGRSLLAGVDPGGQAPPSPQQFFDMNQGEEE